MAKPTYTKPTSQVDLEERLKDGYEPPAKLVQGTDPGKADTPYLGTDPIYQNYANDTEKPLRAEKGVEKKLEDQEYGEKVDDDFGRAEDGEAAADEEEESSTPSSSTSTPPTSTTPPSGTNASGS